ncbi:hypothetical protein AJ79_03016 [Helicocarpus griseus UAMH5409]|uniref:ABC transporter domain-containing protein n=1 Tax=Helicocarpus griseus UAMH5409 TaxID=1447875 RepID=A0A2B7Y0G2_9EURO|nr:hypothetical protein AJ79_03016 [Helicocarpus griseus UAMH5409]
MWKFLAAPAGPRGISPLSASRARLFSSTACCAKQKIHEGGYIKEREEQGQKWNSGSQNENEPAVIAIKNATFYRQYPSAGQPQIHNPPLFPKTTFYLQSSVTPKPPANLPREHWVVIGSSDKSNFLDVLRGRFICTPPAARSYPYLTTHKAPADAIQYVGFSSSQGLSAKGIRGSHMSARYESRKEITDFTLLQYLNGQTSLNPLEEEVVEDEESNKRLGQILRDLKLQDHVDMPVSNLSNGQTRRAMIAEALVKNPEVLIVDEPFMGMDQQAVPALSRLLYQVTLSGAPRMVLGLRPQDPIPSWVSKVVVLGQDNTIALQGDYGEVFGSLKLWQAVASRRVKPLSVKGSSGNRSQSGQLELLPRNNKEEEEYKSLSLQQQKEYDGLEKLRERGQFDAHAHVLSELDILPKQPKRLEKRIPPFGEPVVEMDGVHVQYGDKVALGDWTQEVNGEKKQGLCWQVLRGQRWGIFGPNGSGKTTLVSLITSDHPQTYSQPVKLFGRSRLPEPGKPGISIFDLQSRLGHSSPEIHNFFPGRLSIRASLESSWAETFISKPNLTPQASLDIDSALRFFEADLNPDFVPWSQTPTTRSLAWANTITFSTLSAAQQRLVLFLRALLHKPDLIILDEPFSGMSPSLRDKCLHFLEVGEQRLPSTGTRNCNSPDYVEAWNLPPLSPSSGVPRHVGIADDQALIVISHVKEEIPEILNRWMRLPTPSGGSVVGDGQTSDGEAVLDFRMGTLDEHQTVADDLWGKVWESEPAPRRVREETQVGGGGDVRTADLIWPATVGKAVA